MKNKVIKIISYIIFISIIFSVFMPISNALDFENIKGSGTGSNNNASSVSGTGYFVNSTTQQAIVGFRFSVVDSDGNLKLKTDGNNSRTIDMYLSNSTYGSTIYNNTAGTYNVFNSVKNKFQCKSLIESGKTFTMGAYPKMGSNNGSYEITNNTVPTNNTTYISNNKVIDTVISTMSTWNTNSTVSTDITSLVQTWLKGKGTGQCSDPICGMIFDF